MISLFIALFLFISHQDQNPVVYEYKILTSNEGFGMISQNGQFREEKNEDEYQANYLTKKPAKMRVRVDSLEFSTYEVDRFRGMSDMEIEAKNDIITTNRINELARQGWELTFVSTGVASYESYSKTVIKYYFKRKVQG